MAVGTLFSKIAILIGLRVLLLINLSAQILALRTTIRLPSPPLLRHNVSLAEPQPLRCYTEEESGFPVNRDVCEPVLNNMYQQRDSGRLFTVKGTQVPIRYDRLGTPCDISLSCHSPSDEDRFTLREIAQRASLILYKCADEMFGGVALLGHRGFIVRVDSGLAGRLKLAGRRRNGTDVDTNRT